MKHYSIFLFAALFGLAQIAQAADPDDGKKGKQKAQQSVHKAPQSVPKTQKHAGQPPAALKKSSNVPVGASASHQGTPQFKKNQGTATTHNSANVHVQKSMNQQTGAAPNSAKVHVKKPINTNNAAVAAQRATHHQNNAVIATQNAQRLSNQQNNTVIATRNAQRFNNQTVNGGNLNALSFNDAYSRRHRGYHDRNWWSSRYGTNFILFGGGYYYQDSGYWYPAYGYDRAYSSYEYDGPIYGYNNLPPGEVVTNVQSALQQQGYYRGEIDGSIGPLTRAALRRYQRDNGLQITSAIDRPTLASLGLT